MDILNKLKDLESTLTMESPDNWKENEKLKIIGWGKFKTVLTNSQKKLVQFLVDNDDEY